MNWWFFSWSSGPCSCFPFEEENHIPEVFQLLAKVKNYPLEKINIIINGLKTAALVFTTDAMLMFFLRNSEVCNVVTTIFTLLQLDYFSEHAKNNLTDAYGRSYKQQSDGFFYRETQKDVFFRLPSEKTQEMLAEKNKMLNIPKNIIAGGAEVFDTVVSRFWNYRR